MFLKTHTSNQPRVQLNEAILEHFFKKILNGRLYDFAMHKGLSYNLVYNLVHGRIRSLSVKDYRIIFGEDPPYQEQKRVDGEYFRGMVRLWLFLNDDVTEAGLYREFYPDKKSMKVDYRIFSGEVRTIATRLERVMEQKFLDHGLSRFEIKEWIEDLNLIENKERVSYEEIKPILDYLERNLKVNPTRILNQCSVRYETGELKTISREVYDSALKLRERAEEALHFGLRFEIEKLKEEIYGKRDGLTLFSEVEAELEFLQNYGGKSTKKYLGRSIGNYKKTDLKRIAYWRAQKIKNDCNEFLRSQQPNIPLLSIPTPYMKMRVTELLLILKSHLLTKLLEDENEAYEGDILAPNTHSRREYDSGKDGFTRIDHAASVLGMSKRAFDLMVAAHSDIFRRIGIYEKGWYVPDLYLQEIMENDGFYLIKAKYESLANVGRDLPRSGEGARQRACVSGKKESEPVVSQDIQDRKEHMKPTEGREAYILKDRYRNLQHIAVNLM